MRRMLLVLLFVCLPTVLYSSDWSKTVARVDKSVYRLAYPVIGLNLNTGTTFETEAVCSGFSIHEQKGYVLTAEHCLNEGTIQGMAADGAAVELLVRVPQLDLAVLATTLKKPALRPATGFALKGQEVGALGFGYGLQGSLFRSGVVSHASLEIGRGASGYWMVVSPAFVGGMSGGPVFNLDGKVVSIVQLADELSGYGSSMASIYRVTAKYWQYGL